MEKIMELLLLIIWVSLGLTIGVIVEVVRERRLKEAMDFQPDNVLGGARFAENEDLRKAGLFSSKGIPIGYALKGGHPLHYSGCGHLLTVAAARTGKGATLIVNALLSWINSVLVIDPKAELAAITGHYRRRFGTVYVLNPFGILTDALKGLVHARFNPMDILDAASDSFHAECDKIAWALVWEEVKDFHFTTAARILVSGVIAALVRHGIQAERNLVTVARVISGDIFEFCRLTVASTSDPFIIQKLSRFSAKGAEASREVQDVIATAITQLSFIGNAAIAHCLSGSDFRFSDLKRNPGTTVYICLPLNKLDISAKFIRLILEAFLADLLNETQRGRSKPVLAIVDEMAQLGPHMKSLENAMGMAAGAAGLQIWGILQDLSQLKAMFPQTSETFIQNCGVTTWFGARDQTTREYVSHLSGTCEVLVRSKNVSIDPTTNVTQVNESASQVSRPLLLPHEVGQIEADKMIAFVDGVRCGPVMAKREFYFHVFSRAKYRDNPYVANNRSFLGELVNWLFG
jgi:type IV secretion system protein VirD4